MHRVSSALIGAALLSTAAHVSAESVPALQYPDTRKQDLVETQFGVPVADLFEERGGGLHRVLRRCDRLALPQAEGYRKTLLSQQPIRIGVLMRGILPARG